MWKTLKAMPLLPKLLIGLFVIGGVYQLTHRPHPQPSPYEQGRDVLLPDAQDESRRNQADDSGQRNQALARFQAQQAELQVHVKQCIADMQQASRQQAAQAMNGMMPTAQAACQQYMPQWTAQEAYLETEIYRLQTGDTRSSMREITHMPGPSNGGGSAAPSYYHPTSDRETEAVDRWDRGAIRGNSLYSDESGQQHELPSATYYYRNRSTGQFVPSESSTPPNDGADYETLTPQ